MSRQFTSFELGATVGFGASYWTMIGGVPEDAIVPRSKAEHALEIVRHVPALGIWLRLDRA